MDKVHIVIAGRRNTGKSSLINCIIGQEKAVVSDIAGTTTDPVKKSYEIPGVASVVFIDTAGIDDEGTLGQLRIGKTLDAIRQADAAILVISHNRFGEEEEKLMAEFQKSGQPFLVLHNQSDLEPLAESLRHEIKTRWHADILPFSTLQPERETLMKAIAQLVGKPEQRSLLGDIIRPGQLYSRQPLHEHRAATRGNPHILCPDTHPSGLGRHRQPGFWHRCPANSSGDTLDQL